MGVVIPVALAVVTAEAGEEAPELRRQPGELTHACLRSSWER